MPFSLFSTLLTFLYLSTLNNLFITRIFYCYSAPIDSNNNTLVLLHVLFRHGDRAPDLRDLYPKYPLNDTAFSPVGQGQLTNEGKYREYLIGKSLRNQYDDFLGHYEPDIVQAMSTDSVRTKMSCLLVLAGLFPPAPHQKWEENIQWQPIPCDCETEKSERVLRDPIYKCPPYKQLYDEFMSSPEGLQFYKENKELYDYVALQTGLEVKSPKPVYQLYFLLKGEEALGLKIQDWTRTIWPANITNKGVDEYIALTATPKLLRIGAGYIIKKILDGCNRKIQSLLPNQRKIFLYSGHDFNIAYVLRALGLFNPHFPPFGSYLTLELHKVKGIYGFKILYQNYELSKTYPQVLKLPNCEEICPIEEFKKLVNVYLPHAHDCD